MRRRTRYVLVRVTDEELRRLTQHAARLGLALAAWMRTLALKETRPREQPVLRAHEGRSR